MEPTSRSILKGGKSSEGNTEMEASFHMNRKSKKLRFEDQRQKTTTFEKSPEIQSKIKEQGDLIRSAMRKSLLMMTTEQI